MSSTLIWQRASASDGSLSDTLKFALRKRCGNPVNTEMCHDDMDYLIGLRDGGIGAAQELIDAIKEHDSIILREEY